jgi:hypothetical protein
MKATRQHLVIAAAILLAPAASVLAASSDPFAGYQRGIAGASAAHGPAAPALSASMACGHDPFAGYRQAFNTGGPAQTCGTAASQDGAQGAAGPTMASTWRDPFDGYRRGISAE